VFGDGNTTLLDRLTHVSLRHHRDRQQQLPLQEPQLTRSRISVHGTPKPKKTAIAAVSASYALASSQRSVLARQTALRLKPSMKTEERNLDDIPDATSTPGQCSTPELGNFGRRLTALRNGGCREPLVQGRG
jgi:hypothetical protein